MADVEITSGNIAFIRVTNPDTINAIYDHLAQLEDKKTGVEFRSANETIALIFSDDGEVEIGVSPFLAELKAVEAAGGTFLVHASQFQAVLPDGGVPANPLPPDTLCPCSGP